MKCRRKPPGHWVGAITLLFSLCVSVAGMASPWWRLVHDQHCSRFEGLWQQCDQCWHTETQCRFSQRNSGLWRTMQALHVVSVLCQLGAVLCCVVCANNRWCHTGRCTIPSVTALTGGVIGVMANVMFVGYIERYTEHEPREHVYAWSFTMSLSGSILSILAACVFSVSQCVCGPGVTCHAAKPYWPYNHYSIDMDTSGCPHYSPYPRPHPRPNPANLSSRSTLSTTTSATQKRQLFVTQRQGRLEIHTDNYSVRDSGCSSHTGKEPGKTDCRLAREQSPEELDSRKGWKMTNPTEYQRPNRYFDCSETTPKQNDTSVSNVSDASGYNDTTPIILSPKGNLYNNAMPHPQRNQHTWSSAVVSPCNGFVASKKSPSQMGQKENLSIFTVQDSLQDSLDIEDTVRPSQKTRI